MHPQRLKSTIFEIASDGGQLHKVLLETYLETFKIPQTKTELFSGQELYLLVNCNINGTGVHLKDFKKVYILGGKMFFTIPKSPKRIDKYIFVYYLRLHPLKFPKESVAYWEHREVNLRRLKNKEQNDYI